MIAAIQTIFAQPDATSVRAQFDGHRDARVPVPRVAAMLSRRQRRPLAFAAFPRPTGARSGRPTRLERVNREIKRRCDVVGVFPNDASVERLVTAVVLETHDEWAVSDRRYLSETSMAQLRRMEAAAKELGPQSDEGEDHALAG